MKKYLVAAILFISMFPWIVKAEQSSSLYEKAVNLLQQGELKAAEIAVKNSIQQFPNYLPARLLLGEILLKNGQAQSAEKELTVALDLQADSYTVVIPLAKAKLFLHKYQATLTLLNNHPQLASEVEYFLLKGNSYKALLQYKAADESYQKSAFIHGHSIELYIAKADLLLKQNQLELAQDTVDKALAIDHNNLAAQMLKAEILKQLSDHSAALALYTKILQNDKFNKQALFASTAILLEQGKLNQALSFVVRLREQYPNDPYAKLLHSSVVALQGDKRQANTLLRDIQQQFLNLTDEQKQKREVLLLSASVNYVNGNYQQARQQLNKYLVDFGEDATARRHLARIALSDGDTSLAKVHIDKALKLARNDVELSLLAIHIYQQELAPQAFLAYVELAYTKFPDNDLIRDQYVNALILLGRDQEAMAELQSISGNDSIASHTLLGYLQLQNSQFEQAKNTAEQLLKKYPNKVEILQLAGELSLKLGQLTDAKTLFTQALHLDERFRPALLSLAGMSLNKKNNQQTEHYYQRLLTFYPKDVLVLQLYADLAIKQARPLLAIKLLSHIEKGHGQYIASQRALLALYMQTNQLDLAQQLLIQLEQRFSFDQPLLLVKSEIQAKQGNILSAAKTLKILFGLAYDEPLKIERIIHLQLTLPDLDSAKKSIERLAQLTQGQVNPYLAARYALANKEFINAETIIVKQLSLSTTPAGKDRAWQELNVHLLIAQQKLSLASEELVKLFAVSDQRDHLQLLAGLYGQQEEVPALTELLAQWLIVHPADAWAVAQLSQIAQREEDVNKAIKILEAYPYIEKHPLFLNNLANLYQDLDRAKAINYAKMAYKLSDKVAAINDTLGWLLVSNNQKQQGLAYIREAIARDATNANYQYHLAYTLASLKRIKLAKIALISAKELAPQHDLLNTVNKMLSL